MLMFMSDNVKRPNKEVIDFLRQTPTAIISDAFKRLGLKAEFLYMVDVYPVVPSNAEIHVAGPAVTMKMVSHTATYSHLEFPIKMGTKRHFEIVESISHPGDVVVIDGEGSKTAVWGEHMTMLAKGLGLECLVTDGYIRDIVGNQKLGFPLFARGRTMISYVTYLNPIQSNVPIQCGGAFVKPGDLVVGDNDGVVVIPDEKRDIILEEARKGIELENEEKRLIRERKFTAKDMYEWAHRKKYAKL